MKNKLLVKLFSSGLQAVAVQILGAAFFYLISLYLSKDSFGIISWMNAVAMFLTTVLGFGLDQVVVRRIAVSRQSDWAATAFFAHSIIGCLITFLLLLLLPNHQTVYRLLPWFFAAQGLIYMGIPLKQFLNAKERFTPYGIIAVISNSGKIATAWVLFRNAQLDIHAVMLILIGWAAFELVCLLTYLAAKTTFSFRFTIKAYSKLLKEAATPYLSVLFDMSLSRTDWILLGAITTNTVLADYSFAYRAFELARLPMVIIAPIILPRLSRLMAVNNNRPDAETQQSINTFGAVELFFVLLIPLTLNILWEPVVGLITKGKYGHSDSWEFLILSLCIPMQLFVNLLWSACFGARKYRSVTGITITCAVVNLTLNLIMIPIWGGIGAAFTFLLTSVLQCGLYYRLMRKQIMVMQLRPFALFIITAVLAYIITISIPVNFMIRLAVVLAVYLLTTILSKQITRQQLYHFKNFLTR
jgi:O-antigen/teichoic acid export membrane protein